MNLSTVASNAVTKKRIASIDIMRGLVILLMAVDHVRERFFYHLNVADPMDLEATSPALFFTRMAAHLCAPTFVFLTGLGAWLYAHPANNPPRSASEFLFKRGVFLVFIEITLVNFSWFGNVDTIYLPHLGHWREHDRSIIDGQAALLTHWRHWFCYCGRSQSADTHII